MPKPAAAVRVAIYARYSSDLQNPSSIDDQVTLCRRLVAREFEVADVAVSVFSDEAKSGATMNRPGMTAMMRAAERRRFDVLVAEGLDRISRSLKDIATIYERLAHYSVSMHTAHEGRVSPLHVGMKGTMNALALDDMKAKVRRALLARAAEGRHPAGLAYGYRVARVDGREAKGAREIHATEARIVARIFREFVAGKAVKAIARGLNDDGVPSPAGGLWSPTAIKGARTRGDGILRKEAYAGVLVYNRSRNAVDPTTGRRRRIANPESEWVRAEVPALRIVDAEIWRRAQRLLKVHSALPSHARAPCGPVPQRVEGKAAKRRHPFTGLVRCGRCGGPARLADRQRYVCAVARFAKACDNYRGVRSPALVEAVFPRLRESLAAAPAILPWVAASIEADRRTQEALEARRAELAGRIDRLVAAIEDGVQAGRATRRVLALERELRTVEGAIRTVPRAPASESDMRAALARALDRMKALYSDPAAAPLLRPALGLLIERIAISPIEGKPRGSTVSVTLREGGWPAVWRLLAEAGWALD